MTHICNRVGCESAAEFYPTLLIRPKGSPSKARVTIKMPLCESHAKAKSAEEFITEPLWKMIKAGVSHIGRLSPHRSSTDIEFLYIDGERWKTESVFIFEPGVTPNAA